MAKLSKTRVSLRFFGDDLNPDEVTKLLGQKPSKSEKMGTEVIGKATGKKRIARTGGWRLSATKKEPGDLDAQINEILDQLTDDLSIWSELNEKFSADMFCGLFMTESNEGISLSKQTLQKLAERGLTIDFDIYDSSCN